MAWLELVSPSNKPGGTGARDYRLKRQHLLRWIIFMRPRLSSMVFLPSEQQFFPLAHPYRIVLIDPRPDLNDGHGYPSEFDVDEPIPEVKIPLTGNDVLYFDFNAAYQQTFELYFYGQERVTLYLKSVGQDIKRLLKSNTWKKPLIPTKSAALRSAFYSASC